MRRFPPLLLTLALAACGPADGSPDGHGLPPAGEWTAEALARIGGPEDPGGALTRVDQVVIGPDERLHVSRGDDRSIRVYDPDGTLVTSIDVGAEEPDALGSVGHIGLMGDTLYTLDTDRGRVALLSPEGDVLTSWSWRPRTFPVTEAGFAIFAPAVPRTFALRSDGTALVRPAAVSPGPRVPESPGLVTHLVRVPLLQIDRGSRVVDTLAWEERGGSTLFLPHRGDTLRVPMPFGDLPLYELMRDGSGVVVVDRPTSPGGQDATFTVTLIGPGRDTIWARALSYRPLELADEEVDRALEAAVVPGGGDDDEAGEGDPPPAEVIKDALGMVDAVPDTWPPVSHVAAGQDGSVWIGREEVGDSTAWQVLDAAGRPTGELRLPRGQTVIAARADLMVARVRDAGGAAHLVVYRLRG